MAMEIFLKRPHQGVPWGFRIIGGSDSHLPIIVSKVLSDSIAENCGLEEDVLIERINNIPTIGLSHAEVNDIILAAPTELLFRVRRENLENLILASLNDEESNSEITSILRQAVSEGKIREEESSPSSTGEEEQELKREFGEIMTINANQQPTEENKFSNNTTLQTISSQAPPPGKKWSTFLQKPKNPAPKLNSQSSFAPKVNQYRVIIKKQSKKDNTAPETLQVPQEELNIFIGEEAVEYEPEIIQDMNINFPEHITEELDEFVKNDDDGNWEEQLRDMENAQGEVIEEIKITDGDTMEEHAEEAEFSLKDVEDSAKNAPSLEEQLAAVQKQLQELAELPSSIQETLSVVTQQLACIVGEHTQIVEENEVVIQEGEVIDQESEEQLFVPEENSEELIGDASETLEVKDLQSEVLSDICEEEEISEIVEEEVDEERIAQELDDLRALEEKIAKQQMIFEEEEENKLKKSFVRPIILPGGRKWVDPDDAVTRVKNPKMTDDKICNAIETYSELLVGRTKGINFLKYTPPPKNLDYLQRSDVYRLVHGMEPPVKGISIRSEKTFAEQDYYTAGGN